MLLILFFEERESKIMPQWITVIMIFIQTKHNIKVNPYLLIYVCYPCICKYFGIKICLNQYQGQELL